MEKDCLVLIVVDQEGKPVVNQVEDLESNEPISMPFGPCVNCVLDNGEVLMSRVDAEASVTLLSGLFAKAKYQLFQRVQQPL